MQSDMQRPPVDRQSSFLHGFIQAGVGVAGARHILGRGVVSGGGSYGREEVISLYIFVTTPWFGVSNFISIMWLHLLKCHTNGDPDLPTGMLLL